MEECLSNARKAYYRPRPFWAHGCSPLDYIRKTCATGVQCMEQHGAPARM
jgi:hypothetical protein